MSEPTPKENKDEVLRRIDAMEIAQAERFKAIEDKLDPIAQAWDSVSGFNQISVWLFKVLIAIGAAIGSLYVVIEFLRKLSK